MAADVADAAETAGVRHEVPSSMVQIGKLTRYQLREYLASRRFLMLLGLVVAINLIITIVVAWYRSDLVSTNLAFYQSFWGGSTNVVIVFLAVFFGGDAIAGEFENKTGYFLMGLPIQRNTIYVGKFIAAYLASLALLLLDLLLLVLNGFWYFGADALPWQLGVSLVLAAVYLLAVLGTTFLFSSMVKKSTYGIVLTAVLFLFVFSIVETLVSVFIGVEPWIVISYAHGVIANVFATPINWGWTGTATMPTDVRVRIAGHVPTTYTPGIAEGVVIMLAYFVITAALGLVLFRREEFK